MADPFPTYHDRISELAEKMLSTGGVAMLVLDLTPFGSVEEMYGSQVYEEVRQQALQLVVQQRGKLIGNDELLALDEPGGMHVLLFLDQAYQRTLSLLEDVKTRREQWADILLPMISRLALPYLKAAPRLALGQSVALHNPLVRPAWIVARAVREGLKHGELQRSIEERRLCERVQEILLREGITTVYQPIVEIRGRKVFGYEALSRGAPGTGLESADALFRAAHENGLLAEVDRLCRRRALLTAKGLPPGAKIFVNVLPTAIRDPEFKGKHLIDFLETAQIPPSRIVIEITEKLVIENYNLFLDAMSYYTNLGMSFAVDDVGAGYSGLEAIAGLRPGFLKIDMALIRDLGSSLAKREMVNAIMTMGIGIGARVVAEGIQTSDELRSVESIGLELGQGFLLGRPEPI